MRRVLVDEARRRQARRHGANAVHVSLANAEGIAHEKGVDLVALDDALSELATFDELQSKIVELRFFGGLSLEETAEALKISARTVQREWSLAQAWLYRELSRGEGWARSGGGRSRKAMITRSISAVRNAKSFSPMPALTTTTCAEKSNRCSPPMKTPEHSFRRQPSKSPRVKSSPTRLALLRRNLSGGNWPTTELFQCW